MALQPARLELLGLDRTPQAPLQASESVCAANKAKLLPSRHPESNSRDPLSPRILLRRSGVPQPRAGSPPAKSQAIRACVSPQQGDSRRSPARPALAEPAVERPQALQIRPAESAPVPTASLPAWHGAVRVRRALRQPWDSQPESSKETDQVVPPATDTSLQTPADSGSQTP